ncbi:MAG: S8/S53 family peptidase [Bacteroidota bacterium]
MRSMFSILMFIILYTVSYPQIQQPLSISENYKITVREDLRDKILSGKLLQQISDKLLLKSQAPESATELSDMENIVIYYDHYPLSSDLRRLDEAGVEYFTETWIPPFNDHPYGFILARVPAEKFGQLLTDPAVRKIDSGEYQSYPLNNESGRAIKAQESWTKGWTGTGVKVAVLDSGLDTEPLNEDLPVIIEKADYSSYPSIDDNVENITTGHGTHVVGSVMGRGFLSADNTGFNGNGAFKGIAPNADLVFLKIGGNSSSSATSSAMIAAMQAAVNVYDADVLSMSYGGWYAHHDGTSATEQTVDWVYEQGKPFFLSAGNSAGDKRHYSGTVAAGSSTDFIKVNVSGAGSNNTKLYFNLVWSDGAERRNLSLKFYSSDYTEITYLDDKGTTESSKGTESRYTYSYNYVAAGNSTFYLKVFNPSASDQFFHIYEDWGNGVVTFDLADPLYTIGQPASADHSCAVAAYTSREYWQTSADWGYYHYNRHTDIGQLAYFSSIGPRVDGYVQPKIAAPGTVIISIRDRDVYKTSGSLWVDNDGVSGGDANYYVMQGTSMACPAAAGAAALFLSKYPEATPQQVYDALTNNTIIDAQTGAIPNNYWGYGKLNIDAAIENTDLPNPNITVDGKITESKYTSIASKMNANNSFGTYSDLYEIFVSADTVDKQLYIGVTGKIDTNNTNGIGLWLNLSEIEGVPAGTALGGVPGSHYMNGSSGTSFKADFEVDYMFCAYPVITSGMQFDAVKLTGTRYYESLGNAGHTGKALMNRGKSIFSPNSVCFAFDNTGDIAHGLEMRIPFSELGITNLGEIQVFAFLAGADGSFSNVTLPGNITTGAPGPNADFSLLSGGPYHSEQSALPVELVSFGASRNQGCVILNWQTAVEVNTYGFLVQKRIQKGEWQDLEFIQAAGNSNSPRSYSYTDKSNTEAEDIIYRLKITDNDGSYIFSNEVASVKNVPVEFSLGQNYPNPFNPVTTISYGIPEKSSVKLEIYDILGRLVNTLVDKTQEAGFYTVGFSAGHLGSGLYIYRLQAGSNVVMKKMNLIK